MTNVPKLNLYCPGCTVSIDDARTSNSLKHFSFNAICFYCCRTTGLNDRVHIFHRTVKLIDFLMMKRRNSFHS